MKKYIKFLPVLAIVAGISTALAFDVPKKENVQELYWFEVQGGQIQTSNYLENGPDTPCDLPQSPSRIVCAVAFLEGDIGDPDDPTAPTTDPQDPDVEERSYKDDDPQG